MSVDRNAIVLAGLLLTLAGCGDGGADAGVDVGFSGDPSAPDTPVDFTFRLDSSEQEIDQQDPNKDGDQNQPMDLLVSDNTETEDVHDSYGTSLDGLLVCDGVALPCDFDNPGPSPWPYSSCSGDPYYHVCPDDACVPKDEVLQAFFTAWTKEAPGLLNLSHEKFTEHIFVNNVMEWSLNDGDDYRLFRVDFLMVIDWVVVRESHNATIVTGDPLTEDVFRTALTMHLPNHKEGLPKSIISLEDVFEKLGTCYPTMQGDFCHIFWNKANNPKSPKLHLWGLVEIDLSANICLTLRLDLETGKADCVQEVCY